MERKTIVYAEDGKQEIRITREFDLPLPLLFKAYAEPGLVEQWMGTKVLKLENKKHGGYEFETSDANGSVVFRAHGAIHEFEPNARITRTFQMMNAPFDVQLEFLEFEPIGNERSRLTIHIIFRSVELRNQQLKLPFAHGINMAHDRLQHIVNKLK
jgi:uncharacterized protein YndB with AHSA1/START domain